MTEQKSAPMRTALLRNGFGFDIENVDSLPLWSWPLDADPMEDPAGIAVFEGLVILVPFFKIFVGKVYF